MTWDLLDNRSYQVAGFLRGKLIEPGKHLRYPRQSLWLPARSQQRGSRITLDKQLLLQITAFLMSTRTLSSCFLAQSTYTSQFTYYTDELLNHKKKSNFWSTILIRMDFKLMAAELQSTRVPVLNYITTREEVVASRSGYRKLSSMLPLSIASVKANRANN